MRAFFVRVSCGNRNVNYLKGVISINAQGPHICGVDTTYLYSYQWYRNDS